MTWLAGCGLLERGGEEEERGGAVTGEGGRGGGGGGGEHVRRCRRGEGQLRYPIYSSFFVYLFISSCVKRWMDGGGT